MEREIKKGLKKLDGKRTLNFTITGNLAGQIQAD